MKKIIKALVLLLGALVVGLAGGAYLIPEETVVQRQIVIAATPEQVFAIAGDLRRFNDWSPWAELDPATVYAFEGPAVGIGQRMLWQSANPNVGKGSQTVIEYIKDSKLVTGLDFGSMGKAQSSLLLVPVNGGTGVTWGFKAKAAGVLDRWMSLLFDRWIGGDYDKGLAKLKALAEKNAGK